MDLFFYAILIQILSTIVIAFLQDNRKASIVTHLLLVAALVLGFISTFTALVFSNSSLQSFSFFGIPNNLFRFDSLALYFLCIVQLAAIPISIYSYAYFNHYIDEGKPVRSTLVFYTLLLVSTQLLVTANHSILFLIFWEVMSISAYLGMIFEKEKVDVQTGSFYYFVMNHIVVFLLFIFFFLLHHQTNSWFFSDSHISPDTGNLFIILYLLSLTAFGMKAGFMPFHFWLPRAHPIAPTVFSAFLSGIIIKMGIYGILRTFQFLNPTPEWLGWLVLVVSMISAIFGVWYALAQHDIKKLLAYHSVENIGIIGIGIGIGFIGSAYHSIPIQVLGFGGALLHTLNHAIFKSLLFVGSGVIYQNLGTRNIELMGGLVHRGKYFVMLFLIGSIAISGIPPLNGFISEFIIYNGFFTTAKELKNYYPLLMLISAVGLAFVGGLAVACFTKINSIMFLGSERKEVKRFHISFYEYLSLGIFALLCVVIGFYPQPFVGIVTKVLNHGFVPPNSSSVLLNINWFFISMIFMAVLVGILLIYFGKRIIQKKYGRRTSAAWGCGYEDLTPRMQYTASSYADELNEIAQSVLVYHKKIKSPKGIFPTEGRFESHSDDLIDDKFILPGFRNFSSLVSKIEFLSHTDIRYYITFILIIITIYSLIAFLWN
ncbi:MAG: proton-conducting transporter membrane subunit [Ignavibacteriaceae bacterium]|jgi:formate hydrogenlyase subunit 3/multisubunit Na+/H+ antiporter MnhD subunit